MQDTKINHTAAHEAGHALVAHLLKQVPYIATIEAVKNSKGKIKSLGHIRYMYGERPYWQKGMVAATINFAGFWGEMAILGYCNGGADSDFRHAARITHAKLCYRRQGERGSGGIWHERLAAHEITKYAPVYPAAWKFSDVPKTDGTYKAWRDAWSKCEELLFENQVALECLAASLLLKKIIRNTADHMGNELTLAIESALKGLVIGIEREGDRRSIQIYDLNAWRVAAKTMED